MIWSTGRGEVATLVLLAGLVGAALLVGVVLGTILEVGLLRRVQDKDPVVQLLITFAAFMIFEDLLRLIWGTQPYSASEVVTRLGTTDLFGVTYTNYQLLLLPGWRWASTPCCSIFCAPRGSASRSSPRRSMPRWRRRWASTRAGPARDIVVGAVLGRSAEALAAPPTTSLVPGVGTDMIVLSFAVVATAGLGQITGALVAAVMIGLARSLAVCTAPELEVVVPYLIMVLVLLYGPMDSSP